MDRRSALLALLALGAAPPGAGAQQTGKMFRIGLLTMGAEPTQAVAPSAALFDALREAGFAEGRNLVVERRFAAGNAGRLDALAVELVHLNVDLIIAVATPAAQAAQKATTAIPIVFLGVVDPVGAGLVRQLARPDGNSTGLSFLSTELSGKRLEMLKEIAPRLSRAAILWNPGNASNALQLKEIESAARALGVQLQPLVVKAPADIGAAFEAAVRGRAGALVVLDDPVLASPPAQTRVAALGTKYRLPTMSGFSGLAEAGGLIAYGTSLNDHLRRAATYVEKILNGARPADLPVEQPSRFELVINLNTAKSLGVAIPRSLLLRADRIIE